PAMGAAVGSFHVGVAFGSAFSTVDPADPDAVIIKDIWLVGNGRRLPLSPRMLGYDAGTVDSVGTTLNLTFSNPGSTPLILQDVQIEELPRVQSVLAMKAHAKRVDPFGVEFRPWATSDRAPIPAQMTVGPGAEAKIPLANLSRGHHIETRVDDRACLRRDESTRDLA